MAISSPGFTPPVISPAAMAGMSEAIGMATIMVSPPPGVLSQGPEDPLRLIRRWAREGGPWSTAVAAACTAASDGKACPAFYGALHKSAGKGFDAPWRVDNASRLVRGT